jgi:hypothetical protein
MTPLFQSFSKIFLSNFPLVQLQHGPALEPKNARPGSTILEKQAFSSVFQETNKSFKSEFHFLVKSDFTVWIFLQKVDVNFENWTFLKMSKNEKSAGEFCKKSSSLEYELTAKIIILH